MEKQQNQGETCMNVGHLLDNPELLDKEAQRICDIFISATDDPRGMDKKVKTAQPFKDILADDEALEVDWTKFCKAARDDS